MFQKAEPPKSPTEEPEGMVVDSSKETALQISGKEAKASAKESEDDIEVGPVTGLPGWSEHRTNMLHNPYAENEPCSQSCFLKVKQSLAYCVCR